jgi:hypothetical protein
VTVDIRITGADQLARLSKELKTVDKKLPTKLRKAIRDGSKPAVAATKQAILALPVKGTRGGGGTSRAFHHFERSKAKDEDRRRLQAQRRSGLRKTIAGAIKLQIKTGSKTAAVRIVVDETQLPADQRTLPRHLDSAKGWRKPTFGHDPWTLQRGGPWFESTIRRHVVPVRAAILKAMDDLANEIERRA